MASDSEGLRPFVNFLPEIEDVENGFRFGRVTTGLCLFSVNDDFQFVENGFRFGRVTTIDVSVSLHQFKFVENGFRFGRVTTKSRKKTSSNLLVENGFRFGRVTTFFE